MSAIHRVFFDIAVTIHCRLFSSFFIFAKCSALNRSPPCAREPLIGGGSSTHENRQVGGGCSGRSYRKECGGGGGARGDGSR